MTRIGVVGVGSMGQNHARVLSDMGRLAGVADANDEAGSRIASRFSTQSFTDYRDLIGMDDIDGVVVATPTSLHSEVALAAIDAGKHVLVEKPFSHDIKSAKEILDRANQKGVTLAVGHIERHNPVVGFTKKLLESGEFGNLITLAARRVSSFPARIKDVGVILDLGIHDADVIRYLAGSEVESVYTAGGCTGQSEMEDHANIVMQFECGSVGVVEVNWLTPLKVRKVSLTCSKNYVEMDYMAQSLRVSSSTITEYDAANLYRIPQKYDRTLMELAKQEPLWNEHEDFVGAIESGRKPLVTGEDGLAVLQITLAALTSLREGRRITKDEIFKGD